eukprot:5215898-Pyramimonas_sp.AAC.1
MIEVELELEEHLGSEDSAPGSEVPRGESGRERQDRQIIRPLDRRPGAPAGLSDCRGGTDAKALLCVQTQ